MLNVNASLYSVFCKRAVNKWEYCGEVYIFASA